VTQLARKKVPVFYATPTFITCLTRVPRRCRSIDIATGYRLDDRGSISGKGKRLFFFLHSFHISSGAYPTSYPLGTGAFPRGLKRPGLEVDNSLPSTAEVEKCGAISLLLHTSSRRSTTLIKHRDSCTSYIYLRRFSVVQAQLIHSE
jgi:hypothetical protein